MRDVAQGQISPAKNRRSSIAALTIVVIVLCCAWLEHELILRHVAASWGISDELRQADAAVVLGGDINVRPFAAADLYERGLATTILVTNTTRQRAERLGFIPPYTELNREVLLKLGVPATAIAIVGEEVTSTYDEAEAVRAWALQSRAKRIIVPTEPFATRRTRWIFDRELSPISVQVIVHAYPPQDYTLDTWWRHRDGWIDFNDEVLKYMYYRLRY